jgi:hypothetical protein
MRFMAYQQSFFEEITSGYIICVLGVGLHYDAGGHFLEQRYGWQPLCIYSVDWLIILN